MDSENFPSSAPVGCPGTSSVSAGSAPSCKGCPNQSACASSSPNPNLALISNRLSSVQSVVLVLSGKGGVGKSTVTACLARAFSFETSETYETSKNIASAPLSLIHPPLDVGVLDIDITGPSIPRLFNVSTSTIHVGATGWSPVVVDDHLSCMSIGFLLPGADDDAVIWRAPKKNSLISQFLRDVDWGDYLDVLLVDTPPGTSDEHISLVQLLTPARIAGAIIVTTPQELSLQDVRKEIAFCRKVGVKILGLVENMASFVCPNCSHCSEIFAPWQGGAETMCTRLNVPLLARIPLDPAVVRSCDAGDSLFECHQNSPATTAYLSLSTKLRDLLCLNKDDSKI